ncbi:hypothetical protein EV361DRAFT_615822 [Lentinula raphanica]|uniref:Mid2 domain-containing protein n=1 Tax=Lentinula raphanica TaxID=153919 RepID=A0AA38P186_9AGAR|nr:hypothetical protein C8R42DRAFT_659101 [Lentinula raphanica]KAJ3823884.1 hypothetical protein F5880DRAFT_466745 [Lentinula raphanica]KAJ3834423.1 hypothetical protein F5878DRAFT_360217 [Lentinula raphanica]KAJ3974669.1 hypothetical protein EV361DRAFT_615822 [Lentinula raphanica]
MESPSSANISCIQDSWASNSLGQNPCEIAERLNSVCTTSNDSYFVELTSEDDYTLSAEDQNPCLCTSVVYNLVSMCRLCQTKAGKTYPTWSQWTTNCSSLNTGFPPGLPGGTAVPDWAYQDISESDAFNETLALNVATTDHSESSSSALPSSTSTSSATSTPNTQISRDSDDDVAALVGGLLGGLVGLALIVVATLYLIRRRRRSRIAPSIAYLEANRKKEDLARGRYAPVNALRTERVSDLPYNISGDNHSSFSFNPYDTSFANTEKDPTQ